MIVTNSDMASTVTGIQWLKNDWKSSFSREGTLKGFWELTSAKTRHQKMPWWTTWKGCTFSVAGAIILLSMFRLQIHQAWGLYKDERAWHSLLIRWERWVAKRIRKSARNFTQVARSHKFNVVSTSLGGKTLKNLRRLAYEFELDKVNGSHRKWVTKRNVSWIKSHSFSQDLIFCICKGNDWLSINRSKQGNEVIWKAKPVFCCDFWHFQVIFFSCLLSLLSEIEEVIKEDMFSKEPQ